MSPRPLNRFRLTLGLVATAGLLAAGLCTLTSPPEAATAATVQARAATNTCPTPASTVLRTPPGTGRRVALTFDDGPSRYTPQILNILKRERVHGTFFVAGKNIGRSPQYVRRALAERNAIGNHTWNHPQAVKGSLPYGSFDTLPVETEVSEIDRTTDAIVAATGIRPCFFRAPGGHDSAALATIRSRGMSAINWSNSTGDSSQPARTTKSAVSRLRTAAVRGAGPGVILLTHDGKASAEPEEQLSSNRSNSVAALPGIIRWYKCHGYRFVKPDGSSF